VPGHVPAVVASGKIAPLGHLAGTNQMRLAIGLPLRDAGALTRLLREMSDPASPQFHHYLTPAEFTARFGPTPADYATVLHFAETNGFAIVGTHPNRLLVDVTGKASQVERAFQVRLNTYRHPKENRNFFAPNTEPRVDGALPILHISGLDNYSLPHPNSFILPAGLSSKASPRGGSGPGGTFMGADFRNAYVPDTQLTGVGQNVGLVQFDGFYPVDITNYENSIGLTSSVPQLVVVPVDGGVATPGNGDDEVSLDIEMILAMSPGVSNIYVYEAPNPSPWVDMLSQMADDDNSQQLSSSWGGGGPDPSSELIFQQMAAQGQSYFNASGDTDAYTGTIPFPSESTNITQVGGTTLTTDDNGNYVSETVWNWDISRGSFYDGAGSSGGISTTVPIPYWQLGIDMTTNLGSTTMRNIPDVALAADNVYITYNNGGIGEVGGTSCAAPLWAGFMALVNEQAMTAARPSMGFINPAVYAIGLETNYAGCFHDIVTDNNFWSQSPTNFPAAPGYDLCTGWGTPSGETLMTALAGPPEPLGVLPDANFFASGVAGGPFTPGYQDFTLTNFSAASLCWLVTNPTVWLDISASNGMLAAAGEAPVTVSFNSAANSLAPGTYVGAVGFTNQTDGILQTHLFTVQVTDPLELLNAGNLSTAGPVGGPFTPMCLSFTLTNLGVNTLNWSVGGLPSWLSASTNCGTLATNDSIGINLHLCGVEKFPAGIYVASLSVTNQTWGTVQSVVVQLAIGQSIVVNGGFETGDFTGWTLVGNTIYRQSIFNVVTTDNGIYPPVDIVHSGNYGAFLGQGGYLATLSQTLPTISNQLYQVSFWLDNPEAGDPQQFIASWDGAELVSLFDPGVLTWTNFQFLVTAADTNVDLQFSERNDPNYFGFDDVSVTPVPPLDFEAVNFNGSDLLFNWYTLAGLNYEVQFTTNLLQTNWQPLAEITASTNVCSVTDSNIINGDCQRFYRLVIIP